MEYMMHYRVVAPNGFVLCAGLKKIAAENEKEAFEKLVALDEEREGSAGEMQCQIYTVH